MNQTPGSYEFISYFVEDAIYKGSADTSAFTITKAPTTVTNLGVFTGQYSDSVELKAQIVNDITGLPLSGETLTFNLDGVPSVNGITDASGIATVYVRLDQAPNILGNSYNIQVVYGGSIFYQSSSDTNPFTVLQEDARTTFTGTFFASTASTSSSVATVTLSATIQDITDVPTDGAFDTWAGDISNATVTFINRDNNTIINTTPLSVVLVNPSDSTVGTVFYSWTVDIGNLESESFSIGIIVDNYYTRNSTEEDVVVTISKPENDFVTGGGYIYANNSAGVFAADDNSRVNFGFNIKYNKKGNQLKGKINVILRRTESDGLHVYQIKGNVMSTLAVNPNDSTAVFTGKANVQDVTNPNNPISVNGNANFQVNMTDNGNPGDQDSIAFTLMANNGTLLFSSVWSGTQSTEEQLAGGNLVIHTGGSKSGGGKGGGKKNKIINPSLGFSGLSLLNAYPNPTYDASKIELMIEKSQDVELALFDMKGKKVSLVYKGQLTGEVLYSFDLDMTSNAEGTYLLKLITPEGVAHLRVSKY